MASAVSSVMLVRGAVGSAATLTWDASGSATVGGTPAGPVDGGGTWDTSTAEWSNGTSDVAWNNAAPGTATFGDGGTAGTVTLGTAITAAGLAFGTTGSGSYTVGASTNNALTLTTGDVSVAANVTATISSAIEGSNGLTVTGGGTLTLGSPGATNPFAYTGTTTVDGSTLQFNNLVPTSNYTVGGPGAAFELGGATATITSAVSMSKALTFDGNIAVDDGTQATINFSQRTYLATGTNLSSGSTSSLTINYGTTVSRDIIYASASGFNGTLNIQPGGGGELAFVTGGQSYVSGSSYGNFDGLPGTFNVSGAITTAGPTAGSTITVGALGGASTGVIDVPLNPGTVTWSIGGLGASTQYAGVINGANAIKLTGGTLALTGNNTYTGGTTVSAGTLRVNNATGSGTGSGGVTVAAGATLGGSGIIGNTAGPVTVNGTIGAGSSPTDASSTLHTQAQVWNTGGTLLTQFSQAGGAVTGSDQLIVSGLTATGLTGANSFTVDVTNVGSGTATLPASGPGSAIVLATDTDGSAANPFNQSGGAPINLAALELQTSGLASATGAFQFATRPDGGGFDLVLEDATAAAPEPASLLLAGVAVAPLALSPRRRRPEAPA